MYQDILDLKLKVQQKLKIRIIDRSKSVIFYYNNAPVRVVICDEALKNVLKHFEFKIKSTIKAYYTFNYGKEYNSVRSILLILKCKQKELIFSL